MTEEDRARRRAARLVNERLKLIAAFCNTLGVATFVTFLLAPIASDRALSAIQALLAIVLAVVLHGIGQLWFLMWRSED